MQVFSPFMTDCNGAMSANAEQSAISAYTSFVNRCRKQDPYELVEMADRMISRGCLITMPPHGGSSQQGHRLMQAIDSGGPMHFGTWTDYDNWGCPWDRFDDRMNEVIELCCGDSETSLICNYEPFFPSSCSIECGIAFHSLYTT